MTTPEDALPTQRNEDMQCNVEGCDENRAGPLTSYCKQHRRLARAAFLKTVHEAVEAREARRERNEGLLECALAAAEQAARKLKEKGPVGGSAVIRIRPARTSFACHLRKHHPDRWATGARGAGLAWEPDPGYPFAARAAFARAFVRTLREAGEMAYAECKEPG